MEIAVLQHGSAIIACLRGSQEALLEALPGAYDHVLQREVQAYGRPPSFMTPVGAAALGLITGQRGENIAMDPSAGDRSLGVRQDLRKLQQPWDQDDIDWGTGCRTYVRVYVGRLCGR